MGTDPWGMDRVEAGIAAFTVGSGVLAVGYLSVLNSIVRAVAWLAVSVVAGHYLLRALSDHMHDRIDKEIRRDEAILKQSAIESDAPVLHLPNVRFKIIPCAVGIVERTTFSAVTFVLARWSGGFESTKTIAAAAAVWIGFKMAAGWQRGNVLDKPWEPMRSRAQAFAGLFASVASVALAWVCGIFMAGKPPWATVVALFN